MPTNASSWPQFASSGPTKRDKIGIRRPKAAPRRPKAAKDDPKAAKDDPEVAKDAPNATSKPPKTPQRSPEPRSCSHSGLHLPTQTHEICGFTKGKRMIPKSRLFRLRGAQMKPRASKKLPKSHPKHPKGSQKGPPRRPDDPTGRPKGAQRMPKGDFLEPQRPQMPPKVVPKAAQGRPRAPESAKGPILDDFAYFLAPKQCKQPPPKPHKILIPRFGELAAQRRERIEPWGAAVWRSHCQLVVLP